MTVTPLRPFSHAERTAVTEQGAALASFLTDGSDDSRTDSHRVRIAP